MIWEYKPLYFELATDTANMAAQLNQLGQAGWELVNVALVQDGLLAFLKKNSPVQPVAQSESLQTGAGPSLRSRSASASDFSSDDFASVLASSAAVRASSSRERRSSSSADIAARSADIASILFASSSH